MYDRRDFLKAGIATSTALALESFAAAPSASTQIFVEEQRGDPNLQTEKVDVDQDLITQLLARINRDGMIKDFDKKFGSNFYDLASAHVGVSRQANRGMVDRYLKLFNLPFVRTDGKPTAFCAAGATYVAAQNYVRQSGGDLNNLKHLHEAFLAIKSYHFYPSSSVAQMQQDAKSAGSWHRFNDGTAPRKGWLVVYDFGKGRPEHVGIVGGIEGGRLQTVEFNTSDHNNSNGGGVAFKSRPLNGHILGYIQTTG